RPGRVSAGDVWAAAPVVTPSAASTATISGALAFTSGEVSPGAAPECPGIVDGLAALRMAPLPRELDRPGQGRRAREVEARAGQPARRDRDLEGPIAERQRTHRSRWGRAGQPVLRSEQHSRFRVGDRAAERARVVAACAWKAHGPAAGEQSAEAGDSSFLEHDDQASRAGARLA